MLSVLPIPCHGALLLAKNMDIREIRRQNLMLLREQAGSTRALAERVDTDPNYFSQILGSGGKHNMGHQMARRLEKACNKPSGWMDQPHDPASDTAKEVAEIAKLIVQLSPAQRESIKNLVQSMAPVPAYQASYPAGGTRRILGHGRVRSPPPPPPPPPPSIT